MISKQVAESILGIIDQSAKVIDIGGARYPWWRADYIIDKRRWEEKVGDAVLHGSKGADPRFSKETWISHDFYDLPWPFPDKFFDFSLCMGTLEDLRDPVAIAKEIQRISKAGYISTPTRAREMSFIDDTHVKTREIIGYIHHRWFAENIEDELVFKFKNPLAYQYKEFVVQNPEYKTFHFFWDESFSVKEEYYGSSETYIQETAQFLQKFFENSREKDLNKRSDLVRIPEEWTSRINVTELLKPDKIENQKNASFLRSLLGWFR